MLGRNQRRGREEGTVPIEDLELKPEQLRAACDPDSLQFETTADLPELEGSIGQDRALAAINFGLGIQSQGYNVFAAGPTGAGRNFAVTARAREAAAEQPTPDDWAYVYNFEDQRRPRALRLAPGRAPDLSKDVDELIAACRQEIPRAFESESYEAQKESATGDVQQQRNQVLQKLEEEARSEGLMIQPTPMGIATVPLRDGKPMSREQFEQLPEEERKQLNEKMEGLRGRVQEALSQARQLEKEARRRLEDVDRKVAMLAIGDRFDETKAKYEDNPEVVRHLEQLAEDVVSHHAQFRGAEQGSSEAGTEDQTPARYQVNVLVTSQGGDGAPVVEENSPTYYNLAGRLEFRPVQGSAVTDHTLIKAGALHRANGGYLILRALDVLLNPFAWDALKRRLRSRELPIENIGEQFMAIPAATPRPTPIPLNVKVILIGSPLVYFLLHQYDEEFGKLFKVKADFDIDMAADAEGCRAYGAFIATHCRHNDLRHLDKSAAAAVISHGRRLAEDKQKLTTRFASIADLVTEANHWADQAGSQTVRAEHVEQAIEQREYRSRMLEDRVFELIERGDLVVDVSGETLGQANGLALLDVGDYVFGRPSRITARVSPGRAGVVNIEREARLSGQIHQKAVLILSGYLSGMYGAETPLSLSASIAFEQSYGPIEGDSASCAELVAILSSLAETPIRQGIAVTGSVDQNGNIQVIGGANRKIEGFFAVCKAKGLTGDQGVVIPRRNIENLMLRREVVEAVENGQFNIWAISHVDEAIEILTGIPAGGPEQPKSVHGRVDKRLREFGEALRGTREGRPTTVIEVPPGAGVPQPPRPPQPPREPPTPPPPPLPPSGR